MNGNNSVTFDTPVSTSDARKIRVIKRLTLDEIDNRLQRHDIAQMRLLKAKHTKLFRSIAAEEDKCFDDMVQT